MTIDLATLRPAPQDEADLRWRFTQADGDMGLRSLYPGMVLKLQLAGGPPPTPVLRELDPRWVAAAERARLIDRALEQLQPQHRNVLWACYGDHQLPELHAYGDLAGLIPDVAADHHRRSRTTRTLADWLARLARRAKKEPAAARTHAAITREAEALLAQAARAYGGARREVRKRGR